MYYFTKTGEYGKTSTNPDDWQGIGVPTWYWTNDMWQEIYSSKGMRRYKLAEHFNYGFHSFVDREPETECAECELNREQLDIKILSVIEQKLILEEEYYNA
jgi:hypothetical protein